METKKELICLYSGKFHWLREGGLLCEKQGRRYFSDGGVVIAAVLCIL